MPSIFLCFRLALNQLFSLAQGSVWFSIFYNKFEYQPIQSAAQVISLIIIVSSLQSILLYTSNSFVRIRVFPITLASEEQISDI